MRRYVSEDEATTTPNRRYNGLRILKDGRVRFASSRESTPRSLDIRVQRYSTYDNGESRYAFYDSANYDISIWQAGEVIFYLALRRSRVSECFFNINLTPAQLKSGVAMLREAGEGLEGWIVPGLEHTRMQLSRSTSFSNPSTLAMIETLLRHETQAPRRSQRRRS